MVPVVGAEDGQWLVPAPLAPCMKPGGHGAIWKLMLDEGVFRWLASRGREAAIIRQIRCVLSSHLSCAAKQPIGMPVLAEQVGRMRCHLVLLQSTAVA